MTESVLHSALQARHEGAIPRCMTSMISVFAERADNAEIFDVEGRRHVNFAGGIAVLDTKYLNPRVWAAVGTERDAFSHACVQVTPEEDYARLAERLNTIVPTWSLRKTMVLTTGAGSVEAASIRMSSGSWCPSKRTTASR